MSARGAAVGGAAGRRPGIAPAFEHVVPPRPSTATVAVQGVHRVLARARLRRDRPHSPLLGAELVLQPGVSVDLPLEPAHEHGVLVDTGDVTVGGTPVGRASLAYLPPGTRSLA